MATKASSKTAWLNAGKQDRGPHTAVLPSGTTVRFLVPDSGQLLRAGVLPETLRYTALMCAGHPQGADGYMADVVLQATFAQADAQEQMAKAVQDGLDLSAFLVADMLVEPKLTAEDVTQGLIPEPDIRMLLEFAERTRSMDAEGNVLPVIQLRDYARFRNEPTSAGGAPDGGQNGHQPDSPVPDADEGPV